MSIQNPLIVPMTVEALVVNDFFRTNGHNSFMRTQMQYNAMQYFANGQPLFSNNGNDTNFTLASGGLVPPNNKPAGDYYNGVYLKWRLPKAFTNGIQDNVKGTTQYPLVPNRWLIVRYSGALASRVATAWIVESDYLYTAANPSPNNASEGATIYTQPDANNIPVAIYMGRNTLLGTWTESGNDLQLTVMAPGNPAFAFYQPQCNNVFSFIDCTNSLPAGPLSYMVCGWFSTPGSDPLANANAANFADLIQSLGWGLDKGTDNTLFASSTLLYGTINGVQWQNTALPPGGAPNPATGKPISIAVGNSSVEALTAMITAQTATANPPIDSELLEAFQLDLCDVFDKPDGAAILAEKLQASFFHKYSGGYVWNIVDAPNSTTPVSATELSFENAWLAVLNQTQTVLDEEIRQLASLQSQLYTMWWKYTNWAPGTTTTISSLNQQALQNQLDPNYPGSLAQLVVQQNSIILGIQTQVPVGGTPDELQKQIIKYSTQHNLPVTRLLKRSAAPNFYLPNNPVVLIAGAGASGIVKSADTILCRFPSQLVKGFNYNGQTITASTAGLTIPLPNFSKVSGVPWLSALATNLIQEFFFLDPDNAASISAAIPASTVAAVQTAMSKQANDLPVYPDGAVKQWSENPWHPLLMYWQTNYYPIDYGSPALPNWSFDNGKYLWNGLQSSVGAYNVFEGLIHLTPSANFNMEARIQAYLQNNPGMDPLEIKEFNDLLAAVQSNDTWDLLSQALDGFNNQLQLGMPGVYLSPASTSFITTPSTQALIGSATGYPPGIGNVPAIPPPPTVDTGFLPWRAGQFEFSQLLLVDEWGQALWPIDSNNYDTETVYMPADLSPVQISTPAVFNIGSGEMIDFISPNLVLNTATIPFDITVNGANFNLGATIWIGTTALATSYVSSTQLTAKVTALSAGSFNVTVQLGGATSNAVVFTVATGATIGSLSPSVLQAGMVPSSTFDITISGVGFVAGAIAQWNGIALDTEFISSTVLVATVPANFAFAPETADIAVVSGKTTSNTAVFILSAGAAVVSLSPNIASTGAAALTLTVNGVGFEPTSVVQWGNTALTTTFVSQTQLTAAVSASELSVAGQITVTSSIGTKVLPHVPDSFIQLPPALLQPARLNFNLISGIDDNIIFGPSNPDADPICGWVIPNHLDNSLMAYDAGGLLLGEMSIGISPSGIQQICWTALPGSPYNTLPQIATAIPHFGPFLQTLSKQSTIAFTEFLAAIDETLWTTAPMGASFDQSMAILIGRPLAMVRANLQFVLNGPAVTDPSWQYTFAPQAAEITTYDFAVELGNLAQLKDGLIGYFIDDLYTTFNVVADADAATGGYLQTIGVDNNYIYLPFDNTTSVFVSMFVDPYATVHATTAILPVASVSIPPEFTVNALAAMNVTFRVDGILTDQQIPATGNPIMLMPVPKEKAGEWQWLENDGGTWNTYTIAPNDTTARLSTVPPVLRRGLLKLSQ